MKKSALLFSLLVVCAFSGVAMAAPNDWSELAVQFGVQVLLPVLGVALTAVTFAVFTWIRQKTALVKSERVRQALFTLEDLVQKKVTELNSKSLNLLKASSADGKLTPQEAAAAFSTALQEVLRELPDDVKKLLLSESTMGETLGVDVVKTHVEAAVQNQKQNPLLVPSRKTTTPAEVQAARARIGVR